MTDRTRTSDTKRAAVTRYARDMVNRNQVQAPAPVDNVERVARAIWTAPITGQPKGGEVRSWPPSHPDAMTETLNQARAAIAALQEKNNEQGS